jgi:hypothetical protein
MSTQAGVELRLVQKRLKRKLAQARKRRDTEEADPIAWAVPAEALGDGELVLSLEDVPVRKELRDFLSELGAWWYLCVCAVRSGG